MYQIIQGDCIEGMKTLPDESVHCVVTSPPYYGLRDYGTASWEGGDADCDHIPQFKHRSTRANDSQSSVGKYGYDGQNPIYKNICGKCGAVRVDQQIGLEDTPEAYVERLINVFREVRRILRQDGTVWLNLGDSYYATQRGGDSSTYKTTDEKRAKASHDRFGDIRRNVVMPKYLKPKDLIGIPWRVAFALQADGWWLRQDIIWHKPNPIPESVTDRCTKAHEYIFLLTKSERYYYDAEVVKEPFADSRNGNPNGAGTYTIGSGRNDNGALKTGVWNEDGSKTGRNKRSVWTVPTRPYAEAHFAVFPPKLIEPCVLAGSPTNGVVFDPFTGSGTTAEVALKFGRSFIGTELNPKYVELIHKRLSHMTVSMFTEGLV